MLVLIQVAIEHWTKVHSRPDFGSPEPTNTGLWAKVGRAIAPRPRSVWLVTTGLLLLACLGLFKLDASGLSTEDTYTKEFDSIKGQQTLEAHDLADNSNTVQVVTNTGEVESVQAALADVDGLGRFTPPRPVSDDRSFFEAPITEDISSTAAFDMVEASRDAVHGVEGADALVGGGSAFYLDTKLASNRDSKVIIPLVLLVVFLILVGLLRALVAPLVLMGTVVLSFGAALGISALLFEYVFGFAGSDPGFPLFAFVFLVALGIDYNIFLMTRVREETMDRGTREGLIGGPEVDRRRDHVGRPGPGGDVPGARLDSAGVPGRAGRGGGARRAARHDDRPLGPGDGAQPRPRRQDLVAQPARPAHAFGRPRPGAGARAGQRLTGGRRVRG